MNFISFSVGKSLPVILQEEYAECGLICLCMISGFHGRHYDLASLRQSHNIGRQGMSLVELMDVGESMGLNCRPVKAGLDDIRALKLPAIAHWRMEHFVVIKSVQRNRVIIHNPSSGEVSCTFDSFSKAYTGVAVEVLPSSSFAKKDDRKKVGLKSFWSGLVGLRSSMVQVFSVSIVFQLLALLSPLMIQFVVDGGIGSGDSGLLVSIAVGFFLLLLLQVAVEAIRDFCVLKMSSDLNMQMASNLFQHLMKLPFSFFESRKVGDIISRFSSMDEVRLVLSKSLVSSLVDGVMAVMIVVAMFLYSFELSLVVLSAFSLFVIIRLSLHNRYLECCKKRILSKAQLDSTLIESVRASLVIKLNQLEPLRNQLWRGKLSMLVNSDIRVNQWGMLFNAIKVVIYGAENILVAAIGAIFVIQEVMSLGMFFAFFAYKARLIQALDRMFNELLNIKTLRLHFARLGDIVLEAPDVSLMKDTGLDNNEVSTWEIEVSGLTYSYQKDVCVIEDLNFSVGEGESVAIVGPSGSGKSTLLKCMLGLLEPKKGSVRLGGRSISSISKYRSYVSSVMQDDQLLSGSIADNIANFSPRIDMELVEHVARVAMIHDEIKLMPMGYRTRIGDMGNSLSGGQKQRVVLARALYKKPKILYLDEATSHLDEKTEKEISKNIAKLDITRIIVAHRQETISSADRIVSISR
ncbi:peptidase domain-containing ABC transporter [Gilvimarinus sp. SDUM040013]|uniref:Peptidase domain-containing ABC transporter n=1 Tax=Gilvimarinus gilvus TaxID=3058038 RepID=A0ABU4S023_9GAMM|nr:peptidase domain-containing ABC transporter [Gilvimarinus sp. SDUM040013]MDO3386008.1 peptidase domain-containing ABC transporter [Gilvimarinus sp. SDUM040013]MDX6850462.1 peptidase domain-containing ABC transporter [Gilvimarinus sp. SDUM040013]